VGLIGSKEMAFDGTHISVDLIANASDLTTEEKIKSLRGKMAAQTRQINALNIWIIRYSSPDYVPTSYNTMSGAENIVWCEREIIRHTAQRERIAGLLADVKKAVR
jgi:hypothetical protein